MSLQFGKIAVSSIKATESKSFSPWTINHVTLKSVDKKTDKNQNDYIEVIYGNEEGNEYKDLFFGVHKQEDFERKEQSGNNGSFESPSTYEQLYMKIIQTVRAFDEEKATKMAAVGLNINSNEELINNMLRYFTPYIGKKTYIKFVINKEGFANVPTFIAGVNKTDKTLYCSNTYLGKESDVFFNKNEVKKKDAKPTNMDSIVKESKIEDEDQDF